MKFKVPKPTKKELEFIEQKRLNKEEIEKAFIKSPFPIFINELDQERLRDARKAWEEFALTLSKALEDVFITMKKTFGSKKFQKELRKAKAHFRTQQ